MMIAPILAVTVPLTSLTAVLVEVLRATHAVKAAANLAALGSIFTAGYLAILFLAGVDTTLPAVLTVGLIGWFVAVSTGLALTARRVWRWRTPAKEAMRFGGLIRHTLPNLFTTLTLFGLAHVDLFLLSALGTMSDVARYGIALRFSALLVVPLAIANAAFAPLAVDARSRGEMGLLREMLSKLVLFSAGLAALLYAGFALVGYFFIPIWSSDYQSAYGLTLILGVGNVLHACGGAAGILLMIWGDQRCALKITLCTGLVTIALCVAGLTFGGVYGLALAAAAGNALQVGIFVLRVRRLFGLDPSLAAPLRLFQKGTAA
jgi:O-antigen/teichoic acid export membrane protein